jgi:hypothetical protein
VTAPERHLFRAALAITTATGLVYWVMKDLMRPRDEFSVLGHPWQPHMLAAHLMIAPVLVFALGLIAREHILEGIRSRGAFAGWRTGLSLLGLAAPMVLSGYGLQVITDVETRRVVGLVHLFSGALFATLFLAHALVALRGRRAAARRRERLDPASS